MNKKIAPVVAAIVLIIILVVIGVISNVVEKYTPTKERMEEAEFFGVTDENRFAMILQDALIEEKGILQDGQPYLNHSVVKEYLNQRFYWDEKEKLMVYTTPTEILYIPAGVRDFTIFGETKSRDYEIVKLEGDNVYIAAPFVQEFTNMEYDLEEEPNRLVITYRWDEEKIVSVKSATAVRYQGGIKSPILTDVKRDDELRLLEQLETWTKVMTTDGYIGYIETKKISEPVSVTVAREFIEPDYTSIQRDYKINLVWHQVTSEEANYNLPYDTAEMTGVNVISPTWFSIANNDGEITSLASEAYVTESHNRNLEVWGLVDNFSPDISTLEVLSSTKSRENLINKLIEVALEYKLDGINIDFESISEEAGEAYVQFMREISVHCREKGLVLSSDVPVPMPFTTHYDRKEQGIVADYIMIMGYDEHYVGSEAGSVASMSFVKDGIENTLKEVPAEKVINGIPFYTRLWHTTSEGEVTSEAWGMNGADAWVAENGLTPNWSEDTVQDYAEMMDENGGKYQIWLENEASIEEKMKLVPQYELGGVAAWKLGLERPSIWEIISKYVGE